MPRDSPRPRPAGPSPTTVVVLLVVLAAATYVLLDAAVDVGIVRGSPPLLTVLVVAGSGLGLAVGRHPVSTLHQDTHGVGRIWAHVSMAAAIALSAAFCWLSGWSLVLPALATLASVVHVEATGSRLWRTGVVVTAVLTTVGEVGVQTGRLPSVVPAPASHLAALWVLIPCGVGIAYVGRSVAQREELQESRLRAEARLNALMNSSTDVVVVVNPAGVMTYVSPAALEVFDRRPSDLVGRPLLDLVDRDQRAHMEAFTRAVVERGTGDRASVDVMVALPSQERRWHEWTVHNLLGEPLVEGLVVDMRDVSERLLHQEALAFAAAHDPLTGLANRSELLRLLAQELREAAPCAGVALLFLDLDRFKTVNDTHGHQAGDELLVAVARRLQGALRPHDHVARLGGDEFCALITEVQDREEAVAVAQRLEEAVVRPVRLGGGHVVDVGVSIGIAVTTDPRHEPAALLAEADASMYRAKHRR